VQVGILGTVSIAVGLVTLIAQRENSSTDVQIYYHESLAYELVASSIALLVVLSIQVFWPIQFFSHRVGFGGTNILLKFSLTSVHLAWLLVNCAAMAHFVACTLNFVQSNKRRKIREQYTANWIIPTELPERLKRVLYGNGAEGITQNSDSLSGPFVFFGTSTSGLSDSEIELDFKRASILYDVKMRPLRWVIARWVRRCGANGAANRSRTPVLCFAPGFDEPLNGRMAICRTSENIRLTWLERQIVRRSFAFRKAPQ
jgi:hypothetical protein